MTTRIKVLERRALFLDEVVRQGKGDSYDRAERSALTWAIVELRQHADSETPVLPATTPDHAAQMIIEGRRRDARLAIRLHADPAWFALEVLDRLSNADRTLLPVELANLRRLLND